MASQTQNLSVVDVYDIAASIGKGFESIIDNHGPEAVTELMPKVITVLEHLENLAAKNQKENAEIGELRYAVEKLQAEKVAKAEQRERYEQVDNYNIIRVVVIIRSCDQQVLSIKESYFSDNSSIPNKTNRLETT